jgi:hypothetical protein
MWRAPTKKRAVASAAGATENVHERVGERPSVLCFKAHPLYTYPQNLSLASSMSASFSVQNGGSSGAPGNDPGVHDLKVVGLE